MYLFYIDESGGRDPAIRGTRADGSGFEKDHIYVLLAVSLFEHKWLRFETTINRRKMELLREVSRLTGKRLDLADAEVKSTVVRIPKERANDPFFSFLTQGQLASLPELFYQQLGEHHMHLFAVVVDKRHLADYMDQEKLARKAYELLLERIQNFLAEFHAKHLGVIVADDISLQMNRALALKHSYFQREGTTSGVFLRNIVETPFFVRSELSNGIQLADLCAYNVYRAFRYATPEYEWFARILQHFYRSQRTRGEKLDGLKVFPDESPLVQLAEHVGGCVERFVAKRNARQK